ncbi:MAG TPA: ADP-ribosyltransferase [Mycobacteriales bacterium]
MTEPLSWIGMVWPEADEEKLFEAGQQWIAFGARLQTVAADANGAAAGVWTQNEGPATDAFHDWWNDLDGPRLRMAEDAIAAEVIGTALIIFAAATLALKIAFIVQLVILAIEVAQAIATAFVTFGATTAEVPGFIAATRLICRQLVKQVVKHVQTIIRDILQKAKGLLKKVASRRARRAESAALRTAERNLARGTLTDADRAALNYYTTNEGYTRMNPFLRDPSGTPEAFRGLIQARADAVSEGLAKLPGQPGTTYRGVHFGDDVLANYEPGRIVTERAFTSTTQNPNVAQGAFDGNVLMSITGRNGKDVAPFSDYVSEAEILYDKGTNFKVTNKVWDAGIGKWLITMEEVAP